MWTHPQYNNRMLLGQFAAGGEFGGTGHWKVFAETWEVMSTQHALAITKDVLEQHLRISNAVTSAGGQAVGRQHTLLRRVRDMDLHRDVSGVQGSENIQWDFRFAEALGLRRKSSDCGKASA
eukprot:180989-Pyramimonas_sp.AAC.1